MRKEGQTWCCPECGARRVEYTHKLNGPMILALAKLAEKEHGQANLKDVVMTRNQWNNFQKMKYFGLVEAVSVEGKRKKGVWKVTTLGDLFLEGRVSVPASAVTYRGQVRRLSETRVHRWDLDKTYRKIEDYNADAQPHLFGA